MADLREFDIHGLAGIRLLDATAAETSIVARQVGPLLAPLSRDPDITIRFSDRLPASSPVRLLGLDDAGFTDDSFLLLRGKHKSRARVQIPFDRIGKGCEIVCERGLVQVPLLIPILNLTILGNGALPLHASAFTHRGRGFVATGWSKSGKTEVLLAYMAHGASYVGDEWLYLTGDGLHMFGIPEPIRVWSWHLDCLPQYRKAVRIRERGKLRLLKSVASGMRRLSSRRSPQRSRTVRTAGRVRALLDKQLHVDVSPQALFGAERCLLSGVPETILFLVSQEAPEVTVRPLDPREIARRMAFCLQEEQMTLLSYYWRFRFAFPDAANSLLESSLELQTRLLEKVLQGKKAYEVLHPYPVSLEALFEAIEART